MLKAMKQYKRWLRGQNRKFNRTINRRSTLTSQQDHPWKRKHFCIQVRVRSKYQNRKIKTHRGKMVANLDPLNGTEKDCKNKTDFNWITLSEDDCSKGWRNVSHCQQQQSYSGLRSPRRWTSSFFWNDSWVQTFHSLSEYFTKFLQLTILEFFVLEIMVTFLFQRYIGGHCQKCQPKKSQERPCDSMAGTGRKAVSTEIAEHFTILHVDIPREEGGDPKSWGIRPWTGFGFPQRLEC